MLSVRFPDLEHQCREAAHALQTRERECVAILGTRVLALAQAAYVVKARGGTGSDGITWAQDSRKTIAARVRSQGPGRAIVLERKRLAETIRNLKGRGTPTQRARLSKRRHELLRQFAALVDQAMQNRQVGIDSGLQMASGQPGFEGPDGLGGNEFDVSGGSGTSLTVGYARRYSEYFDERHELIPDPIPNAWMEMLNQDASAWGASVFQEHFGK